jgi:hypothetical protein
MVVADFMTKPLQLQGSHFRRLRDLRIGMTSIKKSKKIPNKNTVLNVTKRDGCVKVRELERSQTAVRPDSPTSVGSWAQ